MLWLIDVLAPTLLLLYGRIFLFVASESRNSRVAFALYLGQDLIEARVIRRKKERAAQTNPDCLRLGAEPADNVANIDGEEAEQVFRISEVVGDPIQSSIRHD